MATVPRCKDSHQTLPPVLSLHMVVGVGAGPWKKCLFGPSFTTRQVKVYSPKQMQHFGGEGVLVLKLGG